MIGVAIASIQLLPTAEYLFESQRSSAVDYDYAMTYSFWPWRFITFIAPDIFGNPVRGDYWGYANYWEDAIYIGLLPFLLAVSVAIVGLFQRRRQKSSENNQQVESTSKKFISEMKLTRFIVGLILVSFILALGQNTPVFPWLFRYIPTFDLFQAPTRISILAVFGLALLAGIGVERWHRPENKGLYWTRLGTAGAVAVSLGAGFTWYLLKEVEPTFIRATALAGLWGVGAGVLSLTAPKRDEDAQSNKVWEWCVIGLISVDLLISGWGLNPSVDLAFYRNSPQTASQVDALIGDGRIYLSLENETEIKYDKFLRFDTFNPFDDVASDSDDLWYSLRGVLLPNLNMVDGLPVVNNYDPLVPGRYATWLATVEGVDFYTRERLRDLMAVSVVEHPHPESLFGVRFTSRGDVQRVNWVPCGIYVEGEKGAWEAVFNEERDFRREVVIEGGDPDPSETCLGSTGSVRILEEDPQSIRIESKSDSAGWVTISDVWYPGWKGWLDGEPVPIMRGNYLFRAIPVPGGSHEIQLKYQPIWFAIGAVISTGVMLVVIGMFILIQKKNKR
jgi:hypothetical protein